VRSLAELTLSEPLTDEEYADFLAAAMSARGSLGLTGRDDEGATGPALDAGP
jgi:hypothetical protein